MTSAPDICPWGAVSIDVDTLYTLFGEAYTGGGEIIGSVATAGIMGQMFSIFSYFTNDTFGRFVLFVLIVIFLRFRPQGIFTPNMARR